MLKRNTTPGIVSVSQSVLANGGGIVQHTMSFGDTGAFSASAISCAFWLTLPFLVRIVLIASLKLFCRV